MGYVGIYAFIQESPRVSIWVIRSPWEPLNKDNYINLYEVFQLVLTWNRTIDKLLNNGYYVDRYLFHRLPTLSSNRYETGYTQKI